jgi:hypothetical protein
MVASLRPSRTVEASEASEAPFVSPRLPGGDRKRYGAKSSFNALSTSVPLSSDKVLVFCSKGVPKTAA